MSENLLDEISKLNLLEPISAESPVGTDIRNDKSLKSVYMQIRDLRKDARAAERSSVFGDGNDEANTGGKKASAIADDNWRKILDLAPSILMKQAKDIEVACWYTEALVRKLGIKGLKFGFTLIRGLIEQYWENIFPLPDEDGEAIRVAPIAGLNGEEVAGVLLAPIRGIYITENQPPGHFTYWQYQQIAGTAKPSAENPESGVEQGAKNNNVLAEFNKAVELSSTSFYIELRNDVQGCIDEYRLISQLLDERCGINNAPPTSNIINLLEDIRSTINHVAKAKLALADLDDQTNVENSQGTHNTSVSATGSIKSRNDAFRQLQYISQFFRNTEPHSPISYVIEKAVKWGNMSLAELITDLIPDAGSRQMYSTLTGVEANQADGNNKQ